MPPPGFAAAQPSDEQPLTARPSAPHAVAPRRVSWRRSKLLAGGAVVAACAVLAFLLLGSGGTRLGGPIAQAATLSSSTPGYRMHMSMEVTSSSLTSPVTATGTGVVDLRDHATAMSMVMNLPDDPQVTQELGGSALRLDMIMEGTTIYVKLPSALTSQLQSSGRRWLEVDLAKLSGVPGLSSLASNPTGTDPSQMLQALRSESGSVVNLGQARVDGFQTTHYRAALSVDRLADSLPSAERSAAQQVLSTLKEALPSGNIPVDVWIDTDHLVRRVVMSIDLSLPTGPSMQETMALDISDYGPQSPPVAPSADQVLNLSSLAGAAG